MLDLKHGGHGSPRYIAAQELPTVRNRCAVFVLCGAVIGRAARVACLAREFQNIAKVDHADRWDCIGEPKPRPVLRATAHKPEDCAIIRWCMGCARDPRGPIPSLVFDSCPDRPAVVRDNAEIAN